MHNKEKDTNLKRFLNNVYTVEEAKTFFRNIKDSATELALNSAFDETKKEAENEPAPNGLDYEQYKDEARALLKRIEKKKNTPRPRLWLSVAAAAVLLIVSTVVFNYVGSANGHVALVESSTSFGERKRLSLPDGTDITLNSLSKIEYPQAFDKKQRKVKLSGEAYFAVRKNNTPFVVSTEYFDIEVLGTAFNAKVYEKDDVVSISVTEGVVKVNMNDASLKLKKDEKITLNTKTGDLTKNANNGSDDSVWTRGWLKFHRTPIRDVVRELEREYGCKIIFEEGADFNNLISGEHDNESLHDVLKSIEYTSGIKSRQENDTITLYK